MRHAVMHKLTGLDRAVDHYDCREIAPSDPITYAYVLYLYSRGKAKAGALNVF